MNNEVNNFKFYYFQDEWGQYVDIEKNYSSYISRPFPFSTSKPVTKLLLRPELKQIPIQIPAPTQFKNYDYDIEANYTEVKKEYNNFNEIKTNKKESELKNNIGITTCISVSIITYVLLFVI
jgi:hypothetical protein